GRLGGPAITPFLKFGQTAQLSGSRYLTDHRRLGGGRWGLCLSPSATQEELDHLVDYQQGQRQPDAQQPLLQRQRHRAQNSLQEPQFRAQQRQQQGDAVELHLPPVADGV